MSSKYLNKRYVPNLTDKYKLYVSNNGVFKECIPLILVRRKTSVDKIFYNIDDLPEDIRKKYEDMAIDEKEITKKGIKEQNERQYILNNDNTKNFINDNTPLLPVVGNFLPSDGINAYTAEYRNSKLTLIPILICINCHWSDLFSGMTKYGSNVFCLVSDLPKEKINNYLSEIIFLKDVPKYLGAKNFTK